MAYSLRFISGVASGVLASVVLLSGPAAAKQKPEDLAACRAAISSEASIAEADYRFKIEKARRSGGAAVIQFDVMAKSGVNSGDYEASCRVRRGEVQDVDVSGA
ncbi:MAG: hypothetical protein AAGC95_02845 [Pseudomonadota bacterium]